MNFTFTSLYLHYIWNFPFFTCLASGLNHRIPTYWIGQSFRKIPICLFDYKYQWHSYHVMYHIIQAKFYQNQLFSKECPIHQDCSNLWLNHVKICKILWGIIVRHDYVSSTIINPQVIMKEGHSGDDIMQTKVVVGSRWAALDNWDQSGHYFKNIFDN